MLIRNKNLFRAGLALFVVGIACLIIPPYKDYCENDYANQYGCSGYEIIASIVSLTQTYNGAIAAAAAVVIAAFTAIIKGINRKQLGYMQEIERAYVFGRAVQRTEEVLGTSQGRAAKIRADYIEIALDNHGKTAGYVDDVALSSCLPEQLPKPDSLSADYERSKWTMGVSIPGGGTDVRVTKRFEMHAVRAHVIYGRVYYRDIFGRLHTSGFIQRILSNGTPAPFHAAPEYTAWD